MIAALFGTVLYMARLKVPFPGRRGGRFCWTHVSLFGLFPVYRRHFNGLFSGNLHLIFTVLDGHSLLLVHLLDAHDHERPFAEQSRADGQERDHDGHRQLPSLPSAVSRLTLTPMNPPNQPS